MIFLNYAIFLFNLGELETSTDYFRKFCAGWVKNQKLGATEEDQVVESANLLADALSLKEELPWHKHPRPVSAVTVPPPLPNQQSLDEDVTIPKMV